MLQRLPGAKCVLGKHCRIKDRGKVVAISIQKKLKYLTAKLQENDLGKGSIKTSFEVSSTWSCTFPAHCFSGGTCA